MAEVNITNLAAAHAALDSERRGWRGDILISVILEILTTSERITERDLARLINRLWGTDTITEDLVGNALVLAQRANLVRQHDDGRWQATEAANRDAASDREWADRTLRRAESEFRDRLIECCETTIREDRFPALFRDLLVALAKGAEGIYEAASDSAVPERLRPIRFELDRITEHLRGTVQPKAVARAMVELAVSATDPDDLFANDIVRLVMVGNILHGLLTRRDVPTRVEVSGIRALIDTSVLVYLVEGRAADQVFRGLAEQSQRAGVQLIVAEHTLDEWERLWQAADEELGDAEDALGGAAHILVRNPFVRSFLEEKLEHGPIRWKQFQIGKRDIRDLLSSLAISVRPHGNGREEDQELVRSIRDRLMNLSRDEDVRGRRTNTTAIADGNSCAMVARWRSRGADSLPSGWFIAADLLTGRAYQETRPEDPYPLTVTAETWLLFLAHLTTEEPASLGRLVDAISELTARRAFLSVATGYTVDEALELSGLIAEHDVLSPADLQAAVTADFLGLAEEAEDARTGGRDLTRRAGDLLRRRSARRDARALREEKKTRQEREENERDVADLRAHVQILQETIGRESDTNRERIEQLEMRNEKLKRALLASILAATLIASLLVLAVQGLLTGIWLGVAVALLVVFLGLGARYVIDLETRLLTLILSFVTSGAWLALGLLLETAARG